jgi:hypothetical protein
MKPSSGSNCLVEAELAKEFGRAADERVRRIVKDLFRITRNS